MAANLTVRRLHSQISDMLASGFIGGSGKLYRLEQLAWTCHAELDGEQRPVCAAIAQLLDRVAKRQDGEAVTADEAANLCARLFQPLTRCSDYLIGRESAATPHALIGDLTDAYGRWLQAQGDAGQG